jgi:hypothetical protein
MRQGILTILTPVARPDQLRAFCDTIRGLDDVSFPCGRLIDLHFASMSVIGPGRANIPPDFRPHLVFEASFDGTREDFVDQLLAVAGDEVDRIYRHCEDYPGTGMQAPLLVKKYLLRHDVGADALFIAYPGRHVSQIRQEDRLHDRLAALAEIDRKALPASGLPPPVSRSLVNLLRRQIAAIPDLEGALTPPARPFVVSYGGKVVRLALVAMITLIVLGTLVSVSAVLEDWQQTLITVLLVFFAATTRLLGVWRGKWRAVSVVLLLGAVLVPFPEATALQGTVATLKPALLWLGKWLGWIALVLGGIAAFGLILVQLDEWLRPAPPLPTWDPEHEQVLRRLENVRAQNHMVGLNYIKPGPLRLLAVRIVLWFVEATKSFSRSGMLAGISTIHFARWVVIDKGRLLLFLSHYDGDWDAYLGDFVEQASLGLTAIWSNCVGFPRSWLLMFGGARDQRAFKAYARQHQHETLFVYSAYPHLTVRRIQDHTAVREALGSSLDAAGLEAFVRRL